MANTIITKNSITASAVPTSGQLVQGELAVNVTDKRLFTENSAGTVVEVGVNPSSITTGNLTASGIVTLPDNAISGDKVEGGTINAVTINTLTSGTVDINGGAVDGTSVGASTPSTGAFTSLSASGTSTLAAVNSGALAVTGAISSTTDATLSGVRVGKGAGAIASNTALGSGALDANTTGNSNTASGYKALENNTTGGSNTASGRSALQNNTTGNYNTANGLSTLNANTTGSNNTASGRSALLYNTTGSGNTGINPRNSAGSYAPVFDPTTHDNRFCMGSTGVTNAYIQVAWTVVSDARDKINFAPVPHGLEFVKALQPTAYQFRTARDSEETNGGVRYGFKAQDVLELEGANPVIVDNEDEDKLRMVDTALIPVLVKALQELNAKFDAYVLTHP